MQLKLTKKPKSPVIIEGFPGFGFVGTITTEFLIEHLNAQPIGRIDSEEILPLVPVHNNEILDPLGIFYDKKHNIVIFHALSTINKLEWKIADSLVELAKELKAKELISVEGVAAITQEPKAYFYSSSKKSIEKFKSLKISPLKEGIIMGVTAALLLQKDAPISCIFAESQSELPDSKAAAKIIEVLDGYLGLKIDPKPLLEKAEKFEVKLKQIMEQSKNASKEKEKKELSYFG